MKRIHLFEFEDFPWFPDWIRRLMTRYIVAVHRLLGTAPELAGLVKKALPYSPVPHIIDLCSGSGGPMPEVVAHLQAGGDHADLSLSLTDLYPNLEVAQEVNTDAHPHISYQTEPVNAAALDPTIKGLRTMVCSMHHMRPEVAKSILRDAQQARQPICVFEISDNSFVKWLWWIAIPINIIVVLLVTPMIRPMTWQQLVFTYLIPILPLVIAWDGSVSNARTYTLADMDILLEGLDSADYTWEKGTIKGKAKKLYLMGLPVPKPA